MFSRLPQTIGRPRHSLCRIAALWLMMLPGCRSPYYADRGALLGGLTGAGVGAAIGSANGRTASGAVLGSAVGALTGATVGDALDDMNARNEALIEQQLGRRLAGAATMNDMMAMSRAGLSDDVIVQHLRSHGYIGSLSANDLITLKEQGVSDPVLRALQDVASAPPPPPALQYAPPPVVVEEYYVAPFGPGYWHPRHHHFYAYPPRRSHVHWGLAFHN